MTLSAAGFRALRIQLVVHAAGGLVVLLAATVLSVYKPWGMTPYGRRKRHEQFMPASVSLSPEPDVEVAVRSTSKTPRWVYVVGIHAVVLGLLFLVVHLAGGGMPGH